MNAVTTMLQERLPVKSSLGETIPKQAGNGKASVFQDLLTNSKNSESTQLMTSEANTAGKMSLVDMLLTSGNLNKLIDGGMSEKEAVAMLRASLAEMNIGQDGAISQENIMNMLERTVNRVFANDDTGDLSNEEAMQKLNALTDELNKFLENQPPKFSTVNNKEASLFVSMASSSEILSDGELQKQFESLLKRAENILSNVNHSKSLSKVAPELLKLLEQWTALEKKGANQAAMVMASAKRNGKEQTIWKEMVQAFQRRDQLVARQQYNTNAKVTSSDVSKWLQSAMTNQGQMTGQQGMTNASSMPMSKVEQYVIHMNQTSNTQPVNQQLIDQFQKVMQSSKFSAMANGTSQLNVTLKPENLGEMMVKLTQMNGEMTVKIAVSTTAAKEMLEANMHQLKNMFSPQQVVIEKQDVASQQNQADPDQDDQPMDGHDQGEDHSEEQENQDDENNFDSQFQKFLMNEEV